MQAPATHRPLWHWKSAEHSVHVPFTHWPLTHCALLEQEGSDEWEPDEKDPLLADDAPLLLVELPLLDDEELALALARTGPVEPPLPPDAFEALLLLPELPPEPALLLLLELVPEAALLFLLELPPDALLLAKDDDPALPPEDTLPPDELLLELPPELELLLLLEPLLELPPDPLLVLLDELPVLASDSLHMRTWMLPTLFW